MGTRFEQTIGSCSSCFGSLLDSGAFSDITLIVGGKRYQLHKNILSCYCPYFHALFSNGMKESFEKEIEMTDTNSVIFDLIINFIYRGNIDVSDDKIIPLLYECKYLNFSLLEEMVGKKALSSINNSNVIFLLEAFPFVSDSSCSNGSDFVSHFRQTCLQYIWSQGTDLFQFWEKCAQEYFSLYDSFSTRKNSGSAGSSGSSSLLLKSFSTSVPSTSTSTTQSQTKSGCSSTSSSSSSASSNIHQEDLSSQENFDISSSVVESLANLTPETILELISSDELQSEEIDVFKFIVLWSQLREFFQDYCGDEKFSLEPISSFKKQVGCNNSLNINNCSITSIDSLINVNTIKRNSNSNIYENNQLISGGVIVSSPALIPSYSASVTTNQQNISIGEEDDDEDDEDDDVNINYNNTNRSYNEEQEDNDENDGNESDESDASAMRSNLTQLSLTRAISVKKTASSSTTTANTESQYSCQIQPNHSYSDQQKQQQPQQTISNIFNPNSKQTSFVMKVISGVRLAQMSTSQLFNVVRRSGLVIDSLILDAIELKSLNPSISDHPQLRSRKWKSTFDFSIHNFSRQNGKVFSPQIRWKGDQWKMVIFPKGNAPNGETSTNGDVSFYLMAIFDESETVSNTQPSMLRFTLTIVNQKNELLSKSRELSHKFTKFENDWGYVNFMKKDKVLSESEGFCVNDTVIFRVRFLDIQKAGNNNSLLL